MKDLFASPLWPLRAALFSLCMLLSCAASGNEEIRQVAERYARNQTRGLPGEISVRVGELDDASRLPPCSSLQAFTPQGGRLWGKSFVGVRCLGPNVWNILVPVHISVTSNYVVSARALSAGQDLSVQDFVVLRGDLATLPAGVVTDREAVVGKTLKNGLGPGQPLRQDLLLAPLLIRTGQSVRLISRGEGFTASGEGKAVNNASEGQVAQVRVPSGQTLSGIVQPDGSVEIRR